MTPTLKVGTILIEEGPRITQLLGLESEPWSGNWSVVKALDGFALDRKIRTAGWNFMAAEVKVMFFGALGTKKIHNALKREAIGFWLAGTGCQLRDFTAPASTST